MLLHILLLAAAAHPLESVRLTQMQMFQLRLPYRYDVSMATIGHDGLGRWELQVSEYSCNGIPELRVGTEPVQLSVPSPLRRNAIRGSLWLKLDDCIWFPDDRYHHLDSFILDAEGEYLLVIRDRAEKRTLWPLPPQSPY